MVGFTNVAPEVVLAAAAELDLLAERLAAAAGLSGPATHVLPSGAEEVSLLAANHFNQAAVSHDRAVAQGILELNHAAMTLRQQVASFIAGDLGNAAGVTISGGGL
ncbi:PE family protein [Nocardia sp. CDC159]|uniref:PE family protein n=1 Tax=Nocardia pulmonis TaxID=2951408 RepID=A0A9X2IYB0_9NOCA|nr:MULTISPECIES: PE family protein [Nocardia]MCM6776887.1 PE family protein [Nocardia pulmonis]MCM6789311.1 PE family protein [Nocardia sp. CDC159]